MADTVNTYQPDVVSSPGESLADLLDERGMTQAELATRLGRPRKTINEIVKGKAAIEPDTALQLEAVLGTPASFWLAREARYREWLARSRRADTLHASRAWARSFPYPEMSRWGWVPDAPRDERSAALLHFFGVASPHAWEAVWSECEVAFRRPRASALRREALAAWLRQGELEGQRVDCAPFERKRFEQALHVARSISLAEPLDYKPRLVACFAAAGVAFVAVPEIRRTGVCGATRWLSDSKALVQVSLRYRTDDQLFFSIFHEAAHVLLHPRRSIFIEGARGDGPEEKEADLFAAEHLIPAKAYEHFVGTGNVLTRVAGFAKEMGVSPGIVVGRLQHDGHLAYNQGNHWKRRLAWSIEQDEKA